MKKKALEQFFDEHPSLSISKIGIEAGYVEGKYLRNYLADPESSEEVPKRLYNRILPILKKYGYVEPKTKA